MEVINVSYWKYTQSQPAIYLGEIPFNCIRQCQHKGHTFLLGRFERIVTDVVIPAGLVLIEKSTGLVAVHEHEVKSKDLCEYLRAYEAKLSKHNVTTEQLVGGFINKNFSENLWMTIVESGLLPRLPWEDLPF